MTASVNIDFPVDRVETVGTTSDGAMVGISFAVSIPQWGKPTTSVALPAALMPNLLARLTAATASSARLSAQQPGASPTSTLEAALAHAPTVSAVQRYLPRPGQDEVLVAMQLEADGLVLPVALKPAAARALATALADEGASSKSSGSSGAGVQLPDGTTIDHEYMTRGPGGLTLFDEANLMCIDWPSATEPGHALRMLLPVASLGTLIGALQQLKDHLATGAGREEASLPKAH